MTNWERRETQPRIQTAKHSCIKGDKGRKKGTTGAVIFNWGWSRDFILPGNIWQNLEAFLVVTTEETRLQTQTPEIILNTLQVTEEPPQYRIIWP